LGVLLKSLADAEKMVTPFTIIKGIGITNDGGNKGSFTAQVRKGKPLP
jgi:hypothetical protein